MAFNWMVSVQTVVGDYANNYFPRFFHYKVDAEQAAGVALGKGCTGVVVSKATKEIVKKVEQDKRERALDLAINWIEHMEGHHEGYRDGKLSKDCETCYPKKQFPCVVGWADHLVVDTSEVQVTLTGSERKVIAFSLNRRAAEIEDVEGVPCAEADKIRELAHRIFNAK